MNYTNLSKYIISFYGRYTTHIYQSLLLKFINLKKICLIDFQLSNLRLSNFENTQFYGSTFDYQNIIYLDISNSILKNSFRFYNLNNVKYFNCANTSLNELPRFSNKLERLNISNTYIYHIPSNLINLIEIYCDGSFVTYISDKFSKLETLITNNTNLKKINIYYNLKYLECSSNNISQLPILLSLIYLICKNTLIQNISNLYNLQLLIYLDCSNTNIYRLPNYSDSLLYLNISNTLIESIPNTSYYKLKILIAMNSYLIKINPNMTNLYILNIYKSKITDTNSKLYQNITHLMK